MENKKEVNNIRYYFALILLFAFISSVKEISAIGTAAIQYEISGKVVDVSSGEPLVGATIYVSEKKRGTATNLDGKFSFKLSPGDYSLKVSYIGYSDKDISVALDKNMKLKIQLNTDSETLDAVVVSAEKTDINLTRTEMGVEKMEMQQIKRIPTLMGEVDVIKTIQLLPGVQATSEGASGFSVRGGNYDQNLILVDQAAVYNASHLLGFFSIFNNDAVEGLELYKGDIPVMHGGRMSSLLDIEMRKGDSEQFHVTGGIGLISSRLTVEGPVFNGNTTYLLSGRTSYIDFFFPLSSDEAVKSATLNFWDLNGKIFHRINEKNTLTLNGYMGRDNLGQDDVMNSNYGNKTLSLIYTHSHSENFGTKVVGYYTQYDNTTSIEVDDESGFDWSSKIQDYSLRIDNTLLINNWNKVKFGISTIHHRFTPGIFEPNNSESFYSTIRMEKKQSLETGVYISNEQSITDKLTLRYGVRYSMLNNIGPEVVYDFDDSYNMTDSTIYGNNIFYNLHYGLEPRIGAVYRIGDFSSVKSSYSRTIQYIHMVSNSTGGTPYDMWMAANKNIKPQISDQVSVGYFRNFFVNQLEASVELYYKNIQNSIDFKDHASLYFNEKIDGELRVGKTVAYGAEFMLRFNTNKLNGWVSYTRSKTERTIPEINNGNPYAAPYDKPNDISIVCNYMLNKRISFSMNWVYATGNPITIETSNYWNNNMQLPIYSERNAYRMPDYHRLDIGMTIQSKKNDLRRYKGEWNFSIYNVYNRHNAWSINFVTEENSTQKYAEMIYLFPILPSVSYNLKF